MVETEANGDSWRTYERGQRGRGPSLFGSLGSSCRYNRFLSCLGCSSQPSATYYFPHRTLFHFIGHLGRQSCWVACLCVSSYIWYQVFFCKETTTTEKLLGPDTKAWVKIGFLNNNPTIIENISYNFL